MAPTEQRTKELKEKLAQAKEAKSAQRTKKDTKDKAKEKADADAKAKAAKEEQARKNKERVAAAMKAPTAAPTPTPVQTPAPQEGPWALPGQEAQEIGIHLGVSCDGCGAPPPLIGRVMKCKDCPDFDLCEDCFPERLDQNRAAVAAAAGLSGGGKHPKHAFGARRAGSVMTAADAAKERTAAKADAAAKAAADAARAAARQKQDGGSPVVQVEEQSQQEARQSLAGSGRTHDDTGYGGWKPPPQLASLLPVPSGAPRVLWPCSA
mmetsp:Transcript_859/g.2391  ORF Transcript_859/g.2391 Transcript_859/m.2391 type:complete len:265 (+) Transcript_859:111-905(+)